MLFRSPPTYRDEPEYPEYEKTGDDQFLRPTSPEKYQERYVRPSRYERMSEPARDTLTRYEPEVSVDDGISGQRPDLGFQDSYAPMREKVEVTGFAQQPTPYVVSPAREVQPTDVETTMPTYEQDTVEPFMGLNQRDLID